MFCHACGSAYVGEGQFCSSCGVRRTSTPTAPPPLAQPSQGVPQGDGTGPGGAPTATPVVLPPWASTDWLQAAVGAVAVVGGVIVGCFALFMLTLLAGGFEDIPAFQAVFLFASMAFGAGFTVEGSDGFASVSAVPVPLVLGTLVLARLVADRVASTIATDVVRLRVFAGKIALVTAVMAVVVTKLAAIRFDGDSFSEEVRFLPSSTNAFVGAFVLVSLGALLCKHRRNVRVPGRLAALSTPVRLGITSYGVTAALTLGVGLAYTLVEAEGITLSDLVAVVIVLLFVGGTLAGGTVASSMGAPATLSGSWFDSDAVHLFSSGVSGWVKLMLLVAPGVVAAITWRYLMSARPRSQPDVVRLAATTGACFAICSAVGAAVSNVSVYVGTSGLLFDDDFFQLDVSYNIVVVVGIGLVWGWVGSFGAAIVWGSRNGVPLIVTAAASVNPTPAAVAQPSAPRQDASSRPQTGIATAPPRPATLRPDAPPPDPSTRRE